MNIKLQDGEHNSQKCSYGLEFLKECMCIFQVHTTVQTSHLRRTHTLPKPHYNFEHIKLKNIKSV